MGGQCEKSSSARSEINREIRYEITCDATLVPHELSDEAAAYVSELLNDLAVAFDGQYFAQVRRYYDERRDIERFCQDGQLDLFDYDDVEF